MWCAKVLYPSNHLAEEFMEIEYISHSLNVTRPVGTLRLSKKQATSQLL